MNDAPRLKPDFRRILEAILFVINEAARKKGYVTEYEIVKTIFLADVSHLNTYGRPITFDNYVAMKDGPVPSAVRNVLQPDFNHKRHYADEWPLWDRVPSPSDGKRAHQFVNPRRSENRRVLSETDMRALAEALGKVKELRFKGTRDLTHDHPAFKAAWKDSPHRKAFDIDYRQLMEHRDDDLVEHIVEASQSR